MTEFLDFFGLIVEGTKFFNRSEAINLINHITYDSKFVWQAQLKAKKSMKRCENLLCQLILASLLRCNACYPVTQSVDEASTVVSCKSAQVFMLA